MTAARLALVVTLMGSPMVARAQAAQHAEPAPAGAQVDPLAPPLDALREWAHTLGAGEPRARRAAIAQLRALGHESLPVVRRRLAELATTRVDAGALGRALAELRRRRATRQGNVVDALAEAVEREATEPMRRAVELTSLLDALLAQRTLEAADVLVESLLRVAPNALRGEATRARTQLGALLVPAYVAVAADTRDPQLRRVAQAGLVALGMATPLRAYERIPAGALPALLRVHGMLRTSEALPHLVAHVGDPRDDVHDAAVTATQHFGARALPVLRLRLRRVMGPPPNEQPLDAAAILRLLSERRASASEQAAREALDGAERALALGQLVKAMESLDRAPHQPPESDLASDLASTYVKLGERQLAAQDPPLALRAFRRALRHAPASSPAHARVLQLEAELRLRDGIVDLHTLARASEEDPALARAAHLRDHVNGVHVAAARTRRRNAGLAAAALFTLAALLLYRDARQRRRLHTEYSETAPV